MKDLFPPGDAVKSSARDRPSWGGRPLEHSLHTFSHFLKRDSASLLAAHLLLRKLGRDRTPSPWGFFRDCSGVGTLR